MKDNIVIKGNKYGLTLFINEDVSVEDAKKELLEKLAAAKRFFNEGDIALAFDGKEIDMVTKQEFIQLINENSNLNVVCIMDNNTQNEQTFKEGIEAARSAMDLSQDTNVGNFHKGTLRSGQSLESDSSVIIIGDVNPGAHIVAKGNIVVLGALKGNAYAGANGDDNAFVVALKMSPMQIRIADVIARCPDEREKVKNIEPQIAYISENNICIENLY